MSQEFSASKAQYDPAGGKEVLICLQVTFYYFNIFYCRVFFLFISFSVVHFLFLFVSVHLFYPVINL